ncbi:uncharacterized protein NPIL_174111 [Nephila pilipes]|uniref:Uncharacterized protein n=1 Tax=Nephila pilipes TaxID=299642 RepID=A0A8X6NKL6_NEPPI|nr:uncharacterized protein NPIL_174111 [Nephila pilipes]
MTVAHCSSLQPSFSTNKIPPSDLILQNTQISISSQVNTIVEDCCEAQTLDKIVQPYGAIGKTCRSSDHCREGECCMTKNSMVGGCREMGCVGCPCQPNNAKSHLGDMYLWSCPCSEGLECVSEQIIENTEDKRLEYGLKFLKSHQKEPLLHTL